MPIDWFTVGAQVLNFLVLVWLMKRFLYKPILSAIDTREKKIAAELADADAIKMEARKEQKDYQLKNEDFDKQRTLLLQNAVDEAKTKGQKLLDETRLASETLKVKMQETLRKDAKNLNLAIQKQAQKEVFAISRQTLSDLAGVTLEERMSDVFVQCLREMGTETKDNLEKVFVGTHETATLRSAFDLGDDQRATIKKAVEEIFKSEIDIKYETTPDLIAGIELSAKGHRVAWSISNYLKSLESSVSGLLEKKKSKLKEKTDSGGRLPLEKKCIEENANAHTK